MNEDVLALLIPIIAITMGLLIPIVRSVLNYRRQRDLVEAHHRERLAAIERGMDIPALPESFYNSPGTLSRPRYLLNGMVWLFVGITLFAALWSVAGEDVAWFGLIPAGVGLAFLIYYAIEGRHERPGAEPRRNAP